MDFTFDGINFSTLHVTVEKYPTRQMPKRKYERYTVLGGTDIIRATGGMENVKQTYEIYINGGPGNFQRTAAAVAAALLNAPTPAILTDGYDPDVYREASFIDGAEWENTLNQFGRAKLVFECAPQRYLIVDPELRKIDADSTVTWIPAKPSDNVINETQPVIEIEAVGNFQSGDTIQISITDDDRTTGDTIFVDATMIGKIVIDARGGRVEPEREADAGKFTVGTIGTTEPIFGTYGGKPWISVTTSRGLNVKVNMRWYEA